MAKMATFAKKAPCLELKRKKVQLKVTENVIYIHSYSVVFSFVSLADSSVQVFHGPLVFI